MTSATFVERDERTIAVENASFRWAYMFLSFGILIVVAYRSFWYEESPWDLLLLVILGGGLGSAYQGWHRVISRGWLVNSLVAVGLAIIVAAVLVLFRQ